MVASEAAGADCGHGAGRGEAAPFCAVLVVQCFAGDGVDFGIARDGGFATGSALKALHVVVFADGVENPWLGSFCGHAHHRSLVDSALKNRLTDHEVEQHTGAQDAGHGQEDEYPVKRSPLTAHHGHGQRSQGDATQQHLGVLVALGAAVAAPKVLWVELVFDEPWVQVGGKHIGAHVAGQLRQEQGGGDVYGLDGSAQQRCAAQEQGHGVHEHVKAHKDTGMLDELAVHEGLGHVQDFRCVQGGGDPNHGPAGSHLGDGFGGLLRQFAQLSQAEKQTRL